MQAELKSILETVKGTLVGSEWIHESVDMAFLGSDPNELTDDFTNILLVTNLVHTRLIAVAQEVDIVAILFTNGHIPAAKVIAQAKELDIDLITTPLHLEEVQKILKAEFGTTLDIKTHVKHP